MKGLLVFGLNGQLARELRGLAPEAIFLGRQHADLSRPERCAKVSETRLACISSCSSAASRLLRLRDRSVIPSSALRRCGVASCNVSVSVWMACSKRGLSSSLAVWPRSCSAVLRV